MTTIVKAGSFCPVCMGKGAEDCHHTTDDFHRTLSGYTRTSPPALTPKERSQLVCNIANSLMAREAIHEYKAIGCAETVLSTIEQRYAIVPKVRG